MATKQDQILRIERVFDCTPQEMWAAWTDPKLLAKWISPFPGIDAEVHELQAKKGGRIRFTMVDDKGNVFPEEKGVYEVFDPPRELVQFSANTDRDDIFKGHGQRMKVRFEPVGTTKTKVLFETNLPPDFPLEMARGGFGSCFEKLAAVVSRKAPAGASAAPKPLRLERTFDATPKELYNAWIDPKIYAKWLNPSGKDLIIHEWNAKVGGKVRFDMPLPDGNVNHEEGMFHVLEPNKHIVTGSADKSFLLDVTFEPRGDKTHMVVVMTGVPAEHQEPAKQGWAQVLDNLARVLKGARSR